VQIGDQLEHSSVQILYATLKTAFEKRPMSSFCGVIDTGKRQIARDVCLSQKAHDSRGRVEGSGLRNHRLGLGKSVGLKAILCISSFETS